MQFRQLLLFLFAVGAALLFVYCQKTTSPNAPLSSPFKNVYGAADYVGMETCRSCHQNIYETFMHTGMGQSFDHATRRKSAARFDKHAVVYDSIGGFYYKPFWQNDSLFIREYRLSDDKKDTLHNRLQPIKYIIGSGQHTNSHLYEENGYIYQAPITFYTQKGIWDLAPGFSGGFNSRFNRIIGMECMSCHNSLPIPVEGAENKYAAVPNGIGCERCHGPGSIHVKEKLAGVVIDTANGIDYTIVNPRHLPRDLQMNVCQRCHLQGVSVLKEGKSFDDFRPGQPLSATMDVFLPEYSGAQTQFIMASQAHRLTKSLCYQKTEMTCLTCHNPHISVKQTTPETFNRACQKCHSPNANPTASKTNKDCTLPLAERQKTNNNNCFSCHLPLSPSIDIPHVTIHDHYIRKPLSAAQRQEVEQFVGLACVSGGSSPDPVTRAKGYLHYYESYSNAPYLLDSATHYLTIAAASNTNNALSDMAAARVHLAYLKQQYEGVVQQSAAITASDIKDAWTAYRIGEAYLQLNNTDKALTYLQRAVSLLPLQADFGNKLAVALLKKGDLAAAQRILEGILKENSFNIVAMTNLGFIHVNNGQLDMAAPLYKHALSLNPDYEQALVNMAGLCVLQQNAAAAKPYIMRILQKNPQHAQANAMLEALKKKGF